MAGDGLPFAGRRLSSLAVADTGCSSVFDTALAASASLPYPPPNAHTGFRRIESTLRFVPPGPGGAGAEKMASAASAPVFERVAGIRTIAESGRFKASSFPTSKEQVTGFNRKFCPCDYLWVADSDRQITNSV